MSDRRFVARDTRIQAAEAEFQRRRPRHRCGRGFPGWRRGATTGVPRTGDPSRRGHAAGGCGGFRRGYGYGCGWRGGWWVRASRRSPREGRTPVHPVHWVHHAVRRLAARPGHRQCQHTMGRATTKDPLSPPAPSAGISALALFSAPLPGVPGTPPIPCRPRPPGPGPGRYGSRTHPRTSHGPRSPPSPRPPRRAHRGRSAGPGADRA